MKQFTKQEKEDITKNYLINYNIQELAKQYGVSPARIRTVLRQQNVQIISDRKELWKKRFPRDSDAFESIDTPAKAYWLGFLYADGSIDKDIEILRINLSTKDEAQLLKVKYFLKATNTQIKHNDKKEKDKVYPISYFSISDKKLCQDLVKKGCIPNKTYKLLFPSSDIVPTNLLHHFIRGFFDGDGSIYIDEKRNRLCLNFTGTVEMLNGIKQFLHKENLQLENKDKFAVLHINGNKQVINILNLLYKDSFKEIELDRKKEKFHKFTAAHSR